MVEAVSSAWRAIDSHAHLDFTNFDPDRAELITGLAKDGLGVINVATGLESNQAVASLANQYDNIWATVGIHPTDINNGLPAQLPSIIGDWEQLLSANKKIVAVGEVGLDYFRPEHKELARTQKICLRQFLTFALKKSLPVIFHCRDAYGDLITLLNDYPGLRGVVHCFTGSEDEANQFLELGLYLSFTATITYPTNEWQRKTVAIVPIEKILLETDSPFLPLATKRGQRNDPRTIIDIAQMVAEIKQLSMEEVLNQTTINTVKLFGLIS